MVGVVVGVDKHEVVGEEDVDGVLMVVAAVDGGAGVVLVAGLTDGLVVEEGVGGQHVDVLQPGHDVAHRLVGVSCESCLWPNHISKSLILPSSPLQRHFKSNIELC